MKRKMIKTTIITALFATLLGGCISVSDSGQATQADSGSSQEVTTEVAPEIEKEEVEEIKPEPVDTKTLRDDLVKKLRADYGEISSKEFVTCLGTDLQSYPDYAFGFINAVYEDFDKDGTDEVVAVISKPTDGFGGKIEVQIYKYDGSNYKMSCSKEVSEIDFCTQQRIALFHGGNYGYGIIVDKAFWGSYTRAYGQTGQVFWIDNSADEIRENTPWEYNNIEYEDASHIETQMKECGVPYAENCASYDNGEDKLLCTIQHRNVDDFDWANLENYLTIK